MPDVPNYVTSEELDRRNYVTNEQLDRRNYVTLDALDARDYSTRSDLDRWTRDLLGAMEHVRSTLDTKIETLGQEVRGAISGLSQELARHVNVILEAVRTEISVVDQKYADLPARVTALEER